MTMCATVNNLETSLPQVNSSVADISSCTVSDVYQLDGNVTFLDDSQIRQTESESEEFVNPIPVHIGNRPAKIIYERPPKTWRTLRRDNKTIQALTLPKVANYNMRSLFPKIGNFSLDMRERTTDIAFLTEVWEKREKKKHQFKLEEMLEMGGIKYISTPRPGAQRGGGAAIAVRTENFLISKLNIPIPKSVEVVWGVLKLKVITGKISVIIVCCFYSPPKSRKNTILLDHITHTLQSLLATYLHAGVIISGDRKNIDISALLLIDPTLRQTVNCFTQDCSSYFPRCSWKRCTK